MDDFSSARLAMVDSQIRTSGVTDRRLIAALCNVARERFVSPGRISVAYLDDLQPLDGQKPGRFLLPPATFARLVQLAKISPGERVLDIGVGTGYSAAVLAGMGAKVVGVEDDELLAKQARENLDSLDLREIEIVWGGYEAIDGSEFDAILLEGAIDAVPQELLAKLALNGRLVAPILSRGVARAHIYTRNASGVIFASDFDASVPRLWGHAKPQEFVF